MRPLKLTMTAFGPYASVEVIDFTKLDKRNIFLITGPTGAGKTTIFDGICYAVFGSASSDERDGESLRSHFASDNLLTSVELEFELKGRRYYIKRIPRQQKRKARGDGFTEQKSEAYLESIDLKSPEVNGFGVAQVNEKVGQILGINCNQFRQIVMIPQGEFRKLITADSQEREKILQKIFRTEGYGWIQEKLGDMAKVLYNSGKDFKNRIDENIHNLDISENEVLQNLISSKDMNLDEIELEIIKYIEMDAKKEKELSLQIEESEKKITNKNKEIFSAKESNNKLKLKYEIESKKRDMENKLPEIKAVENRLNKGRKAMALWGLEENYMEKLAFVSIKKNDEVEAQKLLLQEVENLKSSQENLRKNQENMPLIENLQGELVKLSALREKVLLLDEKASKVFKLEKESLELEQSLSKDKKELKELKENQKSLGEELQKLNNAKTSFYQVSSKLESKKNEDEKLNNILKQNLKLDAMRVQCLESRNIHNNIKNIYEEKKGSYEAVLELFFQGQAGLLSSRLKNGEPCPVCGSINHPKPAHFTDGFPNEETLEIEKANFQDAQVEYNNSSERYNKLLGEGNAQRELLEKLKNEISKEYENNISHLEKDQLSKFLMKTLENIQLEIKKFTHEKSSLEAIINNEESIVKKVDETIKKIDYIERKLSDEEKLYLNLSTKYNSEKELLLSIRKEVPETVDTPLKLEKSISNIEMKLKNLKENLESALEKQKNSALAHMKALTNSESVQVALNGGIEELRSIKNRLNAEVIAVGFNSIEDYKENKLTGKQLEVMDKEISTFNENLKSITDTLIKAEEELRGFKNIDILQLEEELSELNISKEALLNKKTQIFARKKQNEKTISNIKELKEQLKDAEEKYKVLGELANVARGNNSERITFERYVLAAFFDDIIHAANIRFIKITGGRYEMSRIREKGKGSAQSGLEIEVLDNYTGRVRHIKTLSGGESFKASLSLALGLADVVQCHAGGISLDTMFIDEGFGTLDPESLDNAIQSLVDLQNSGRLVGIISHVPELKERIDGRLEIIPGREGSKTSFNL